MPMLKVFDPPMCCPTGVCGTQVDPASARFSADLEWLRSRGASVERFDLAREPGDFADQPAVKAALEEHGLACLPLVLAGDRVISQGAYPSRPQLACWAGLSPEPLGTGLSVASSCCAGSRCC